MTQRPVRNPKVDSRTSDSIAPTLADILTISKQEAKDRINTAFPDDVFDLQEVFSTKVALYGVNARKWRAHTMSRLPLKYWKSKDGFFFVERFKEASLKYMGSTAPEETDHRALDQLENREMLHFALVEILPAEIRNEYASFLEWTKVETQKDSHPVLSDMALARCIYVLEHLFYREYAKCERELRSLKGLPKTEATPHEYIGWLADRACTHVNAHLCVWGVLPLPELTEDQPNVDLGQQGQPQEKEAQNPSKKVAGELTLEVLCNITANRALLENARIEALANEAVKANVALLQVLNRYNLVEVPEVNDDHDIKRKLSDWFGENGVLVKEAGFNALKGDSLEVVIHHATEVQKHYLGTRAMNDQSSHCLPDNRFIFALSLVACRYGRISLDKEFLGDTNPRYQAFPAQNKDEGVQNRLKSLPPHARELIKSLYSQIFYSNKGWGILAKDIPSYSENSSLKRSCVQELIFDTFKRIAPSKLLKLHKTLSDIADKKKALFDQPPSHVAHPKTTLAYMLEGVDELLQSDHGLSETMQYDDSPTTPQTIPLLHDEEQFHHWCSGKGTTDKILTMLHNWDALIGGSCNLIPKEVHYSEERGRASITFETASDAQHAAVRGVRDMYLSAIGRTNLQVLMPEQVEEHVVVGREHGYLTTLLGVVSQSHHLFSVS